MWKRMEYCGHFTQSIASSLLELPCKLNEEMYIKHFMQLLVWKKYLVNVNYYFYSKVDTIMYTRLVNSTCPFVLETNIDRSYKRMTILEVHTETQRKHAVNAHIVSQPLVMLS